MQTVTGEPITDPAELARIIAEIVREGKRWNQGSWWGGDWFKLVNEVSVTAARESLNKGCGTTGCVAGWAAILHAPDGSLIDTFDNVVLPDGRGVFAETYGQEALALTRYQAGWLFSANRTQEQVLYVLDAIAEGREWSEDDAPADPANGCLCGCCDSEDDDEDGSEDSEFNR